MATNVRPLLDDGSGDWEKRLERIVDMMRAMSLQTDPQEMVRSYTSRLVTMMPVAGSVALSRRDLAPPKYRITRASIWSEAVNPWKQRGRLPVLEGGLLGELIYGDQPRIIDDLHVDPDDPAAEHFAGHGSLAAIPNYDQGVALNMVVVTRKERAAFSRDQLPELVWMSNLFGRATHNLVLNDQLREAYELVDRELKMVADIQQSLLPARLPEIPGVELAVRYETSRRAGGDYYDFFPLPDGKWGILIADVSGHGTPAAVMMAITHSIAHQHPGPPTPPGTMLAYVNQQLATRYTATLDSFVTAFYGIYDPATRKLVYASAGHNPPRLKQAATGAIASLDGAQRLPLGISAEQTYGESSYVLEPGDKLVFFTDGITDSQNAAGESFGAERLDKVLAGCTACTAEDLVCAIRKAVDEFAGDEPAIDDRTLLTLRVV